MSTMSDDAETFSVVRSIFEDQIPFNRLLGLTIESMDFERVKLKLPMREDLVGNYLRGSLHGGVVSATLDLSGGLIAFLGVLKTLRGMTVEEKMQQLANMGTLDLRIDYLRPGLGKHFLATAFRLRTGSRVVVTRMELHNQEERLLAVGTGAYFAG